MVSPGVRVFCDSLTTRFSCVIMLTDPVALWPRHSSFHRIATSGTITQGRMGLPTISSSSPGRWRTMTLELPAQPGIDQTGL